MPIQSSSASPTQKNEGNWLSRVFSGVTATMWLRFLLALGGLTVAFAAALFSSVTRETGSFWATLVLSSVALLLAVLVGITTVPYLARRVAGARIGNALHYEVTRMGIAYVVVVIVIAVAALNTGNNLLYIIVAAMLAAILVSGFASAAVLANLVLEVRTPEHIFAGDHARASLTLYNAGRWLPSFSISVVAKEARRPKKPVFLFRKNRRKSAPLTPSLAAPIFTGSVYFPYLPAKTKLAASIELRFARRGLYRQEILRLSTRFPFAFLNKTRRVALQRQIVVFPTINAGSRIQEILPLISGDSESFLQGRGHELYRIREYQPEDSARHVDWKATAKSGSLKVREFTREDDRRLRIVFDNPSADALSAEDYERGVDMAAALAWHLSHSSAQVSFASQACPPSNDVYQFLHHLALVEPTRETPEPLESLISQNEYNIVVTARPESMHSTGAYSNTLPVPIRSLHQK